MGKTGRIAPCPCGSGKKYKKCCGGAAVKPVSIAAEAISGALDALLGYVHFHLLVLDGVYRREGEGRLVFVPVS